LLAVVLLASAGPILLLRWVAPPTTAFMLQSRLSAMGVAFSHRWVDYAQISPSAALAVVAAEDQDFPYHSGFDVDSIAAALDDQRAARRTRGASTITQQVAKNLFLWPGRSWLRKAIEAYLTAWIELLWPKRRILEVYLNVAQLGPGIFGVGAASELYFYKEAALLTPDESALLAAVLPNPLRLRADRPSDYVIERRDWILEHMRKLGGPSYLAALDG